MQTLFRLHCDARTAHLDISPSNILILNSGSSYDTIRVLDLGFAAFCEGMLCEAVFVGLRTAPSSLFVLCDFQDLVLLQLQWSSSVLQVTATRQAELTIV